jgi:aryl-alcohol dehydrogenase-like predicted oxidoreductase
MSDDVNDRGLSRKHIMESVNQSLQRVGTDYLDFYFCHRYDEHTPLEETVRAMDDLVHQGKILYWGTSQWSAEQLDAVMALCDERGYYKPAVEQPHYSMFVRDRFENEILPTAEAHGMGLVSFSPLASGLLTGKYDDGIPEDSRLGQIDWIRQSWLDDRDLVGRVKALKPIADDLGINRAQLALAWTLRQPALTSVITGASRLSQLESNLKALDVELSADVLQQIDAILA